MDATYFGKPKLLTIACVLWQDVTSPYHPFHVKHLRDQVLPFAPEHRFVCLTNAPWWESSIEGVELIPLRDGNPGWWAKVELFRPGLFDDRVLYLDLDVEVIDDLSPFFEFNAPFAAIDDYENGRREVGKKQINSSVMAFQPGAGAAAYTPQPPMTDWHGDQGWTSAALPGIDRFPRGWCPSYKWDVRTFGCPKNAKVIVYHGDPKPWAAEAREERAALIRQGKMTA